MFLAETWLLKARLGGIKETLQMRDFFGVSKVSLGGVLTLLWKKDVVVDVESSSLNHINVLINKEKEDDCGLMDLGFVGCRFTWFKK